MALEELLGEINKASLMDNGKMEFHMDLVDRSSKLET
jgi:hypothetical protein